ncbi:hypothetical protein CSA37_09590 [Candidatus Fermentibacteria bacterium]|nr:MAG: hypothetical protein CSA37_09590 [Candidatus Fermentibacteria bacterium]
MRISLLLAVVAVALCFGDGTATQTDWSGGAGTPGPVTDFGDMFHYSSGVDHTAAGEISASGKHILDNTVNGPRWTDVGDIDEDGDIDILICAYTADTLYWLENLDGMSTLWERHIVATGNGPSRNVLADIDGDMDLDAVCGYYLEDCVEWYENDGTGGTWTEHSVDSDVDGSRGLVAGDIDDDGDMDLFGASYRDDYVCWWENSGSGSSWIKNTIGSSCNGPRLDDACDLDYDGDLDVCVGLFTGDSLLWYENNGIGNSWTRHTVSGSFNGARGGWFNDFNGDSHIDIVCAGGQADSLCWFENADNTGTSWTRHTIDVFNNPWMCNTADVDDDGDSDVMICGTNEDICYWYENDGSGNFTSQAIADGLQGSMYIGAFDVDMDEVMEIVISDASSDVSSYYDVLGYDGVLYSSVFDAQEDPAWGTISWTDASPAGAAASFRVRSSDDPANMGIWSSVISTSGTSLDAYTDPADNYIQYAVHLESEDMAFIPVLEDVTIDWAFSRLEENCSAVDGFSFSILSGNPCEQVILGFNLPQSVTVDLTVFDLTGRTVSTVTQENLEAGAYQVTMERLVPGTYFVRMNAGDFSTTEKLVLTR